MHGERVRRAAASREMQGADGLADRGRLGTARNRRHAKQKANRRTTPLLFFGNPCTKTAMFWPNPHSEHHGIRPRARRCFQRAVETRENARPPAQKASKKLPIALFDDAQNAILTRTDSKPCTVPHGEANRSQSKGPYGELQAWRAGTGSNLYAYGINSV